jgi:DNA repair photolyase
VKRELRSRLLELLAPITIGDALLPGVTLAGASTEFALRFDFDASGRGVHVEIAPADQPGPAAARTNRLRFSFHGHDELGLRVCQAVAARVAVNETRVLAEIARDAVEEDIGGARVREVHVDHLLDPARPARPGHYTLSPYAGCLIGCRFCYAQAGMQQVRRLSGLPSAPWGSFADVRINAAEVLAAELERLRPRIVQFCPIMSDPYHALEARYRVTRTCLEVLARATPAPAVLLLTRSAMIVDDAALIARVPHAWAGVSLPTIDDAVRSHFEPRAASVIERLAVLEQLRAAGVRTFAVVQPLLPGPIDALADALAMRVSSVRIDGLHGEYGAGADVDAHDAARTEPWQKGQAAELAQALAARGVPVWRGELPAELER